MTFELVEIDKARPRSEFGEIGASGLVHSAGRIQEEFLVTLQGEKAIRVYKEMRDNDPVIGGVMMALLNLVRQASWTVEPFSDSDAHEADAKFLRECIEDMKPCWKEFISEAMSMVVFGWSFFETVFKIRDGKPIDTASGSRFNDNKIGWKKFGLRSQDSLDRWEIKENGELTAMSQRPAPNFDLRTIPISKGVLFRTVIWKDNPEGRSILRNAYRQWYLKKRMEEVEGIGVERDLNGIPVMYVPPNMLRDTASTEQKKTLKAVEDMVSNVRNDSQAGLVLPSVFDANGNQLFKLELLTTLGRKSFDTNAIISRMNKVLATSMLADFVLVGQESVGSFAMASSKTKMFSYAIGSYMDTISDQFNDSLIPRLFAINGQRKSDLPKLIHGDIETIDLDELAAYINALSGAGLDLTGEIVREHLAQQAGIPSKSILARPVENQPFFSVTSDGIEEE